MRLRRQVIVILVLGIVTTISVAWVATARTWLSSAVLTAPVRSKPSTPFGVGLAGASTARAWYCGSRRVGAMHQCVSWTAASEQAIHITAVLADSNNLVRVDPSLPSSLSSPPFWSLPRRDFDITEPAGGYAYYEEVAAGWPLPALRWTRGVSVNQGAGSVSHIGAWTTPAWARGFVKAHDLPCAPIVLGFVADTLAFAMGWFILLFGYPTFRRLTRRAAGHCPKCGYNLRGDLQSGCPECGWNRAERVA